MKNIPDEKRLCPRTGFSKGCRDLCLSGACQDRWVDLKIRHPQTGIQESKWGCVDDLSLLVQLSLEARLIGVQVAVEKRGDALISTQLDSIVRQQMQHNEAIALSGREARNLPPPNAPKFLLEALESEGEAYGNSPAQLSFDTVKSANGEAH